MGPCGCRSQQYKPFWFWIAALSSITQYSVTFRHDGQLLVYYCHGFMFRFWFTTVMFYHASIQVYCYLVCMSPNFFLGISSFQEHFFRTCNLSLPHKFLLRTGFARDSGYERTFSKLPKVIQVQWKLPKEKDFYVLIYGYFNQNRPSLLSNVSGDFGHKCRRLPTTRWRCRRQ